MEQEASNSSKQARITQEINHSNEMLLLLLLLKLFFAPDRCAVCFVLLCFACSYLMFSLMYARRDGHIKRHSKNTEREKKKSAEPKKTTIKRRQQQFETTSNVEQLSRVSQLDSWHTRAPNKWNVEMLLFWNALPVYASTHKMYKHPMNVHFCQSNWLRNSTGKLYFHRVFFHMSCPFAYVWFRLRFVLLSV